MKDVIFLTIVSAVICVGIALYFVERDGLVLAN